MAQENKPRTTFYYDLSNELVGIGDSATKQVAWMGLDDIPKFFEYAKSVYILKGLDFDTSVGLKAAQDATLKE